MDVSNPTMRDHPCSKPYGVGFTMGLVGAYSVSSEFSDFIEMRRVPFREPSTHPEYGSLNDV